MNEVGLYEAKTHLSRLVDRASRGERITITRHGTPVAMLVPVAGPAKMDRAAAIQALKEFGKGRTLAPYTIRELIEERRRF